MFGPLTIEELRMLDSERLRMVLVVRHDRVTHFPSKQNSRLLEEVEAVAAERGLDSVEPTVLG